MRIFCIRDLARKDGQQFCSSLYYNGFGSTAKLWYTVSAIRGAVTRLANANAKVAPRGKMTLMADTSSWVIVDINLEDAKNPQIKYHTVDEIRDKSFK